MTEKETMERMVEELFDAEKNKTEVNKLTDRYPDLNEKSAYQVQMKLVERKCREENTSRAGWKLGLTSKAKQEMMGVHEPTYGVLLENMQLFRDDPISLAPFIHPKIEPEFAFIFNRELKGPGVTAADVLAATGYIAPALEIIDSRYRNFSFTLQDVIADNSSSSRFIISDELSKIADVDLSLTEMVFQHNGTVAAISTGASVMGHPARAIAWMVNKLAFTGQHIRPGEVVLSGALAGAISIHENDIFSCTFENFGTLEVSFAK